MKQIVLSIEQMKYLESLGLDTSDASLLYLGHNQFAMNEREDDLVSAGVASYAYTLNDILEKLPEYIDGPEDRDWVYGLEIANSIEYRWVIDYINRKDVISEYVDNSLLDAAYKMLCWCIENNYINN